MRKLVALCLLSLHLLSLGAGLVAYAVSAYCTNRFFEKQTSRGLYNIHDLTEVKIPAYLPGIADQKDYIRVFGEVRFADAAYNYVCMKMTSKAVYLLCVPNYSTTRLCGQNIIDATKIPGIPVPQKDHIPFDKNFSLSVFNFDATDYAFLTLAKPLLVRPCSASVSIFNSSITSPGEPPEVA